MTTNFCIALVTLCSLISLGCHSHGIDVTIQNNTGVPLRNVEVDYPGAAFGTAIIPPGGSYWYHIKPTQDGDITLGFEQESGKSFKQRQAAVRVGERGRLIIIVDQDANQQWHTRLEKK